MSGVATNVVVGLQAANTLKIGAYGAAEADAVEVGFIDGGVKFNHEEEKYLVKVDQAMGPIDAKTISEGLKFKVRMAEATLANMALAFGYPTSAVSGSTFSFGGKTSNTNRVAYINVNGPNGGSSKYTLFKVQPLGAVELDYKKDDKTMYDVEFIVLEDTTKTAEQRFGTRVDTGADTTAPTIAMTTPATGGTRASGGKTTVLLTITEANPMDENSIVYGDNDDATIRITKQGSPSTLVAGSISYDSALKTVTFTPTDNWSAGTYDVVVSTGLKDQNGNRLASTFIGYFTVS